MTLARLAGRVPGVLTALPQDQYSSGDQVGTPGWPSTAQPHRMWMLIEPGEQRAGPDCLPLLRGCHLSCGPTSAETRAG